LRSLCLVFLALFFSLFSLPNKADAPIIEHTIVDDGWVEVPLDFIFPFWGNTYTTSFMFANGVIGFISPNDIPGSGYIYDGLCCNGQDFSSGATGVRFNFTIMPFHTDLIDIGAGHFYTQGDETFQSYFWEGISEYRDSSHQNTFSTTIYPLGNIQMTYEEIEIQNHSVTVAVVGDLSQGEYIQWFYNHPSTDGGLFWNTAQSQPIEIEAGTSICDAEPLSSLVCNYYPEAYAEAYYEEQCTANPLYDSGCTGYYEAYVSQQCSIDSLWSNVCPNFETAYLDQQCQYNATYSVYCPGYDAAVAEEEAEIELEMEEYEEELLTPPPEAAIPSYDTDFFDMPMLDDYEIEMFEDDYFFEMDLPDEMPEMDIILELEAEIEEMMEEFPMEDFPIEEPMEEPIEEPIDEPIEEPIDEPDQEEEPVQEEQEQEESEQEEVIEEEIEEETEGESDSEESEDDGSSDEDTEEETDEEPVEETPEEEPEDTDEIMLAEKKEEPTAKEKKASKEKKMREIITNKLKSLAKEVGEASSLQAQKDLQAYIIALLNYNSGFNTGTALVDGAFYEYEDIYTKERIPENQRGLRNGLANQILHNKLVDLQWQK